MVTVTLNELWLHDADDHADHVRVPYASMDVSEARQGEVRTYAGGRRRLITGPAKPRTASVTAQNIDRAIADEIVSRRGSVQMVRDGRGRVLFGTFFEVSLDETPGRKEMVSVGFTVHEVTRSVEV